MSFVDLSNFYHILHPRPVVLVVTCSREGRVNVMSASWITPIAEDEPTLGVAISRDTYTRKLLDEIPELTINVPSIDLVDEVWKAGTTSGREVDKTKILKLRFASSEKVRPPHIEDCVGYVEAKVRQIVPVAEVDFIICDVLLARVRSDLLYRGQNVDHRKARILLHVAGRAFSYIRDIVYPRSGSR
ncbi:MAG: flavin reductase family protein [Crenarchaeota archaeon]|nr:flavin reductase family protein [Thermoproteota archaeon]